MADATPARVRLRRLASFSATSLRSVASPSAKTTVA